MPTAVWDGLGRPTPLTAFSTESTTLMQLRTRRSLFVLAAVACALVAAPSARVDASTTPTDPAPAPIDTDGVQPGEEVVHSWALTPAGNTDPDAAGNRPELAYEADPGTVIQDAVTLYNYSNEQLIFRVYATDAFNTEEGKFDILPGDQDPIDVGSWVKVEQENISVPPGTQVTIPITITVPAEATSGDHAGAVLASSPTLGTGEGGNSVVLDRRTGTRLYLRVNGPVRPELAITGVDTTYHQSVNPLAGSASVQFTVENRGNTRLTGEGTVEVGGPFGLGAVEVPMGEVPELLPGQRVTMTVELEDVPALLINSTKVTITPTGDDVTDAASVSGSDTVFAPPLAVLLVLLAIVFGWLAVRRLRRHAAAAPGNDGVETDEREPQHA